VSLPERPFARTLARPNGASQPLISVLIYRKQTQQPASSYYGRFATKDALAGLGTLTPETSCNEPCRIGGDRGYCNTVNPSHLSDIYAAFARHRILCALKKSTRSVARQAKEYGREEHRRMGERRGAPRKRQELLWQKPPSHKKTYDQLSQIDSTKGSTPIYTYMYAKELRSH
jgi:hypothetical protein